MRLTGIITFLAVLVMYGVSYADDVYINQTSGTDFTADIKQEGSGNEMGNSTTSYILDGDNHTLDVDQIGDNNKLSGFIYGNNAADADTLTLEQRGDGNEATVKVGTSSTDADDVEVTLKHNASGTGDSNETTVEVGQNAESDDVDIDVTVTGSTNIITLKEDSIQSMLNEDKKVTNVIVDGSNNTVNSTHSGAGDHDTIINHTGSNSAGQHITVTQDGANNTTVQLTTNSDNIDVKIDIDD